MSKSVILCVDDDKTVLMALEQQLTRAIGRDAVIELAENGEEAIDIINEVTNDGGDIALVISDHLMPGMKGDELLIAIHNLVPGTFKILLTGQASMEAVRNAINKANLYRYMSKPWEDNDMILTVREAFQSYLQRELLAVSEQQNQLLHTLNHFIRSLNAELSLSKQVDIFLNEVREQTGSEKVSLFLYEESKKQFKLKGIQTNDKAYTEILKSQLITERDKISYEQLNLLNSLPAKPGATDCVYKLPLSQKKTELGWLLFENTYPNLVFDSSKRELIELMASQALEAFEKSRLYARLEEQNRLISEKNEDITESIRYAARLQGALLPSLESLQKVFPNSFTWNQPKDILSGDFFWYREVRDDFFIAVADCTGHGIPGALMAVLGSTLLSEIILQQNIIYSDLILNELHRRIAQIFQAKNGQPILDGMDIALCRIDRSSKTIEFAGANRPIVITHKGAGNLYEPNKLPIGHSVLDEVEAGSKRKFQATEIPYRAGDILYLFSDGVTDQFGGDNQRKFSKKRFVDLLFEISDDSISLQEAKIKEAFTEWTGDTAQLDDILVVGVQLE